MSRLSLNPYSYIHFFLSSSIRNFIGQLGKLIKDALCIIPSTCTAVAGPSYILLLTVRFELERWRSTVASLASPCILL